MIATLCELLRNFDNLTSADELSEGEITQVGEVGLQSERQPGNYFLITSVVFVSSLVLVNDKLSTSFQKDFLVTSRFSMTTDCFHILRLTTGQCKYTIEFSKLSEQSGSIRTFVISLDSTQT